VQSAFAAVVCAYFYRVASGSFHHAESLPILLLIPQAQFFLLWESWIWLFSHNISSNRIIIRKRRKKSLKKNFFRLRTPKSGKLLSMEYSL